MRTVYNWFAAMLVLTAFIACDDQSVPDIDELLSKSDSTVVRQADIKVTNLTFSDDYKVMTFSAKLLKDVGGLDLSDSSFVRTASLEVVQSANKDLVDQKQPELVSIKHVSKEEIAKIKMKLLVLVDLSLSQQQIDNQRRAVEEIRSLFGQSLYVSFMYGDNVSETYEATDYILQNYFKHRNPDYVYLYRSILTKMDEMTVKTDSGSIFRNIPHKVMIILSDGKTWQDDAPVDPQHFDLQRKLTDKAQECAGKLQVYYAHFADSARQAQKDEANIIQYLCKDLSGLYTNTFNWSAISADIMHDFGIDIADYVLTFEFPDGKVFYGRRHDLTVDFFNRETNAKIATGTASYYLGSLYHPVVVRGDSLFEIFVQGLLITLLVLLVAYIVFQLLVPYISYNIFKRKYITHYTGSQMSFHGQMVGEECYYCKAPFKEGDEIVTKCKHTMHKECWEENEYQCPEYGRHCKEGSHYYNSKDVFDSRNALFYLKWIVAAVLAAFVAWAFFTMETYHLSSRIVEKTVMALDSADSDSVGMQTFMDEYAAHLIPLPAFGLVASFFLTLFLSWLTIRRSQWMERSLEMLVRSVGAGILGWLCFYLDCVISIVLHTDYNMLIIEWIPWALMSCIIMFAVTIDTRIRVRRIFLLAACILGLLSMYIWASLSGSLLFDSRLSLLLSFITYSVGVAVCIAQLAPRSERYFLHVEGAVKEMDIALYKWLRHSPSGVVSIGKSVDCSIQLSWDLMGQVAPLQAEIHRHYNSLRLKAVEPGVFVGDKPLAPGREIWLYHGRRFTIGNTIFTYIEKDI